MRWLRLEVLTVVAGVTLGAEAAGAQAGRGMGMGRGMMGMAPDSTTMAQMLVIHELVVAHQRITRTVTNLPNGVRTVTTSDDPGVAKRIKDHVLTMDQRVRKGDDPGLPMESPALRAIFLARDRIDTRTDTVPAGVIVVQTSSDSAVVAALQQHAAEVTDLVARGMAAMRDAMMKNMRGRGK
jgi:hypothetical protein